MTICTLKGSTNCTIQANDSTEREASSSLPVKRSQTGSWTRCAGSRSSLPCFSRSKRAIASQHHSCLHTAHTCSFAPSTAIISSHTLLTCTPARPKSSRLRLSLRAVVVATRDVAWLDLKDTALAGRSRTQIHAAKISLRFRVSEDCLLKNDREGRTYNV